MPIQHPDCPGAPTLPEATRPGGVVSKQPQARTSSRRFVLQ
jgi:hypothetical protein